MKCLCIKGTVSSGEWLGMAGNATSNGMAGTRWESEEGEVNLGPYTLCEVIDNQLGILGSPRSLVNTLSL